VGRMKVEVWAFVVFWAFIYLGVFMGIPHFIYLGIFMGIPHACTMPVGG